MGMGTLMTIHGEVRWLVVILAVVIIIKFAIGWLGKRNYAPLDRTLLTAYTILLDINILLGLIVFIFRTTTEIGRASCRERV